MNESPEQAVEMSDAELEAVAGGAADIRAIAISQMSLTTASAPIALKNLPRGFESLSVGVVQQGTAMCQAHTPPSL